MHGRRSIVCAGPHDECSPVQTTISQRCGTAACISDCHAARRSCHATPHHRPHALEPSQARCRLQSQSRQSLQGLSLALPCSFLSSLLALCLRGHQPERRLPWALLAAARSSPRLPALAPRHWLPAILPSVPMTNRTVRSCSKVALPLPQFSTLSLPQPIPPAIISDFCANHPPPPCPVTTARHRPPSRPCCCPSHTGHSSSSCQSPSWRIAQYTGRQLVVIHAHPPRL